MSMLYRKYRPQSFSEVVGQEHVVKTLIGALTTDRVGHAYLFAGPRGTGKTTVARILAKAVNCDAKKKGDPDNACDNCTAINEGRSMDLIEIDAASNRGIDEIRNIKESAGTAAPGGGYKIFLIDEVHMLTKDAFNALLKILEEPPAHVVFILATTEAQKILPTVLSRVQRFDFKKLTHIQIAGKLKKIAGSEKMVIDDDALASLAMASDGALRDAEVSLTKALASSSKNQRLTLEFIQETLGLIPIKYHPQFLGHLVSKNQGAALEFISKIYSNGVDLDNFSKEFLEYLRKVLITRIDPTVLASVGQELPGEHGEILAVYAREIDPRFLVKIISTFTLARNDMKISPIAPLPLELAVMELCST